MRTSKENKQILEIQTTDQGEQPPGDGASGASFFLSTSFPTGDVPQEKKRQLANFDVFKGGEEKRKERREE